MTRIAGWGRTPLLIEKAKNNVNLTNSKTKDIIIHRRVQIANEKCSEKFAIDKKLHICIATNRSGKMCKIGPKF